MEFLDRFSLEDVAIVFIGLVIVSIIRIWYDGYENRKKASRFGSSLGIYNTLLDDSKEGLFILTDDGEIVFSNIETADILNVKSYQIDKTYLETLIIGDKNSDEKQNLLDVIYTKSYLPHAYIDNDKDAKSLSISVNKIHPNVHMTQQWYVVILQDMTQINELREGAQTLLDA